MNGLLRLDSSQTRPAAAVAARAFYTAPVTIHFYPDDSLREKKLFRSFQFIIRYGVLYGEVLATSDNMEGIAVWLPPDVVHMSFWGMIRSGGIPVMLGTFDAWHRIMPFNQHTAAMHHHNAPFRHWYLQLIAVDPDIQGKGYGSKLMRPMLERIDREELPCYLETHTKKNVSIYEHYGFKVIDERIIPGSQVNHRAMLRE